MHLAIGLAIFLYLVHSADTGRDLQKQYSRVV